MSWPPRFRVDPAGGLRLLLGAVAIGKITVDQAESCFTPCSPITFVAGSDGVMCDHCHYIRTVWTVCPNGCDTSEIARKTQRNSALQSAIDRVARAKDHIP